MGLGPARGRSREKTCIFVVSLGLKLSGKNTSTVKMLVGKSTT